MKMSKLPPRIVSEFGKNKTSIKGRFKCNEEDIGKKCYKSI